MKLLLPAPVITLAALLLYNFAIAQNTRRQADSCNCTAHFDFVRSYMEQNHAAFHDNVPPGRRPVYDRFCAALKTSILNDHCTTRCSSFIDRYLKFFKDRHIYINEPLPTVREDDTAAIRLIKGSAAFKNTETISLNAATEARLEKRSDSDIEGIYFSYPYKGYKVAVLRQRDQYKGIILESTTALWTRGQVKFILTPQDHHTFTARVFLKDHSQELKTVHWSNGSLDELFLSKKEDRPAPPPPFEFRELNDSTCYLRVGSFWGDLYGFLDSCYARHYQQIISTPYLVIDIRDNGGGSEKCYQGLIDLIYTNPIANDMAELYATPGNILLYQAELEKIRADSAAYGPGSVQEMQGYITKMQQARPYTFIPMDGPDPDYTTRGKVHPYPKKVGLIFNRNCASAAESFIAAAMQSKKTTTFGEHSGGYTGYGNVFAVPVPGSNLTLGCTTTRYKKLSQYEGVGILPQHRLDHHGDWLAVALAVLYRKSP